MDEKKLFCPMSFNLTGTTMYCHPDKCQWWSEQYQKCAVLLTAEATRKQVK